MKSTQQSYIHPGTMAEGAPKHTPVENLERGNEHSESDDAPSFARFLEPPPELRVMVYEGRFEESETVPSAHTQPDLAFTSRLLRQEALHTFYTCSTFAATMNIWDPLNDQGLETSLDRSTDNMLDNIAQADLSLIRKVKLLLVFNMKPNRRFEVTFDFTQWHDFARAVRIERVMPKAHIEYEDYFTSGIREAMETMFNQVRPENGKRVTCERVLSVAETEVDTVFYCKKEWYEMAYYETLEGLGVDLEDS